MLEMSFLLLSMVIIPAVHEGVNADNTKRILRRRQPGCLICSAISLSSASSTFHLSARAIKSTTLPQNDHWANRKCGRRSFW